MTEEVTTPIPLSIVALDDDDDFRQFLISTLEGRHHEVRAYSTPAEFFTALDTRLPDVVLLDMKMGRFSGEDVLLEIRKKWPRLCVIVLTGYPSMDSMRQTFKQDIFDYLAKPFSLEDLTRTLDQATEALGLGQTAEGRLRRELGKQLRLLRAEKEWTLKDLSEACNISVSQLSSIERGAHLPSLESLFAIAAALDAKVSTWMSNAGL